MSATKPSGPDAWEAMLCRLAELAGAYPALSAELVRRIHNAGRDAALVRVLTILEDLRASAADHFPPSPSAAEDWDWALDAVRTRLVLLQASGGHEAPTDPD